MTRMGTKSHTIAKRHTKEPHDARMNIDVTGAEAPSIEVNDAAPQRHQTGHSCVAQHL